MSTEKELALRVQKIEERNLRVEKDKAWEGSLTRRLLVTVLTYATIVLFFFAAELPNPFLNAAVPSAAFLISTVTIGFIKKRWLNTYGK